MLQRQAADVIDTGDEIVNVTSKLITLMALFYADCGSIEGRPV